MHTPRAGPCVTGTPDPPHPPRAGTVHHGWYTVGGPGRPSSPLQNRCTAKAGGASQGRRFPWPRAAHGPPSQSVCCPGSQPTATHRPCAPGRSPALLGESEAEAGIGPSAGRGPFHMASWDLEGALVASLTPEERSGPSTTAGAGAPRCEGRDQRKDTLTLTRVGCPLCRPLRRAAGPWGSRSGGSWKHQPNGSLG